MDESLHVRIKIIEKHPISCTVYLCVIMQGAGTSQLITQLIQVVLIVLHRVGDF